MRKFIHYAIAAAAMFDIAHADAIDDIAHKTMKASPVAGFSVGVMRGGHVVALRGYGDMNAGTVSHIDSISKNITSAAILLLVDEGKLHLDDPVEKYVPEMTGRGATVRNLLNQTSGIPSFTSLPVFDSLAGRSLSHAQILALVTNHRNDFAPGTSWRYDNTGFYLLGMIVERVSGQSYGAYIGALFRRLGMNHSSNGCAAQGHEVRAGKVIAAKAIAWENAFAGGSVCSTVGDLLIWEQALQHGGLLRPATFVAMTSPTRLADGVVIDYGFGTRLGDLGGHRVMGHTGSGGGFKAVLKYFPGEDLTIAVLVDTEGDASANTISTAIARALLNIPATISDKPAPRLSDYVGIYRSDDGDVKIFVQNGKLAFGLPGKKKALGVLRYQGDDVFAVDPDVLVKNKRVGGKLEWIVAYEGGLMMDPKRRAQR